MDRAVYMIAPISSQKYSGESDVLELAQVAKFVLSRQSLLTRPAECFRQPPLRDPHPCLPRRDRMHIGGKVTHVQTLCLVKHFQCTLQISLGVSDASHPDTPAIPVFREPGVLTHLRASQQVLCGGMQVITLTEDLTHTHIHISRSAQCRRASLHRQLQCLLVGTHGIVEATLRDPYSSQGSYAIDCVRDVPGLLQTRHAIGIRPVCCLEISARPICEPQEPRCPAACHMVVLGCEVERPLGICHGPWHIASSQGQSGTGNRDHTW